MRRRLLFISLIVFGLLAVSSGEALAQRRAPASAQGRVVVVSPQRTVVYPPWYGPWGWGWPYRYPYPYPYPPYPYYGYYSNDADLRIQATPRETEVFVDGAIAGIVDNYDGIFQRLHLRPGEHEITLYLAGYRTWSERRYFGPRSDQRILHTMLPLPPGQPDDPRPVPMYPLGQGPGDYRPAPPRTEPRPEPRAPETPVVDPRSFGTLSVGVNPPDAEVVLDGQKQTLSERNRLVIQLPDGVHHLVIRKSGYDTFETDLQIRRGRTLAFDVNLVK